MLKTKKPSVFGGTMIIAGTAIGAGMLALPTVSAGMWIWWSFGIMIFVWLMMFLSSQALLEVNLNYNPGASFHTLIYDNLGKFWNLVNGLSVAFVLYILIYAYVSGGGATIEYSIKEIIGVENSRPLAGFSFGIVLCLCVWWSTFLVDRISVVLLGGMVLTFIFTMSGMLGEMELSNFIVKDSENKGYVIFIWAALSTYLTSFCFHASVPSLVKYFGRDAKSINKCLLYGTLIALCVYMVWIIACDGNISRETFKEVIARGGNVDDLIVAAGSGLNSALLLRFLEIFAFLAVATSFLGAGLGLFDYIADLCGFDESRLGRTKTLLVSFAPPIIAGILYPNGFLYAIGWAGLAATLWSVIIPALLLQASRKKNAQREFRVVGGSFVIYLLLVFGIVVGICHILFIFNLLPLYK